MTSTFSLLLSFQRLWSSLCCSAAICPASRPLLSNDTPEEPCKIKNKKNSQILSFGKKKKNQTHQPLDLGLFFVSLDLFFSLLDHHRRGLRRPSPLDFFCFSQQQQQQVAGHAHESRRGQAVRDRLRAVQRGTEFFLFKSFFCFFNSQRRALDSRARFSLSFLSLPVSTPRSSPSSPTSPSSPRARTSPWRAPGSPRTARRRSTSRSSE